MAHDLQCPHCFSPLSESTATGTVTCPHCGGQFAHSVSDTVHEGLPPSRGADSAGLAAGLPPLAPRALGEPDADACDIRKPANVASLSTKGLVTMVLLTVGVLVSLLEIGTEYYRFDTLQRLQGVRPHPLGPKAFAGVDLERRAEQADNFCAQTGILALIVQIITIIVFLVWIYHANSNLRELHASGLEFSPGWAVGWFFVPVMNLFRPCQVVQEIYRASDPERTASTTDWKSAPTSALVVFWWLAWIINNLLAQCVTRMSMQPQPTLDSVTVLSVMNMISIALHALAAVLLIRIVQAIGARQERRSAALAVPGNDFAGW